MEDTLREVYTDNVVCVLIGLNPCFNGRYSQRLNKMEKKEILLVLILVLMEDTLRDCC